VILPQTSRNAQGGSTTYEKKFAGGYVALANANAVMDLSMSKTRKGVKDELSKWEDIPGRGDPEDLFFGRFTAFRRTKDWKILEISTPEVDSGATRARRGARAGPLPHRPRFRQLRPPLLERALPECGQPFVHEPSADHRLAHPQRRSTSTSAATT
jgi:phage terminase large subunit GpA-like protein